MSPLGCPDHHLATIMPDSETTLVQVYVVAWIRRDPPALREVLRIQALSRPELLFGVSSALRKGRIQPGLELTIVDCPGGEATQLRAEIEERMTQAEDE